MNENILTDLPPELLDTIFTHCAIYSDNSGSKHYIKYKLQNNDLVKYKYIGDMGAEGLPHGRGIHTTYTLHNVSYNNNPDTGLPIDLNGNNVETIWLYAPLLSVLGNYNPPMMDTI